MGFALCYASFVWGLESGHERVDCIPGVPSFITGSNPYKNESVSGDFLIEQPIHHFPVPKWMKLLAVCMIMVFDTCGLLEETLLGWKRFVDESPFRYCGLCYHPCFLIRAQIKFKPTPMTMACHSPLSFGIAGPLALKETKHNSRVRN